MTARRKTGYSGPIVSMDLIPRPAPKFDVPIKPRPARRKPPKVQLSLTADEAREIARRKHWPEGDLYVLDNPSIVDVTAVEDNHMTIRTAFIAEFRGWDRNGVENTSRLRVVNTRTFHSRRPPDSRVAVA